MSDVLLIDDNADDVELARRAFQKVGLADHIHVEEDGTAALDYLLGRGTYAGKGTPVSLKLILLDLKLPKTPGLEVLSQIRRHKATKALPVVVLSASRNEPDLLQSFAMGVKDYLIKPLNAERFVEVYRQYVKPA